MQSSRGIGHLRRWARARPVAAAAAAYTVLAVVFLAPGLLPDHTTSGSDYLWSSAPWNTSRPADVRPFGANRELVDPVTVFQPFVQYSRDRQPGVPLWNPHIQAGRPLLADEQSAVFSPFSLPSYVLPFWWSLSLVGVLKLVVAALGTFLLGRALGMRLAGAFLAGLVYAFGLFFVVWLPWPLPAVWALIPWLLWLTDRLVRRPDLASGGALAAVVGLQYLAGHPESSFHAMVVTVAFFALRAWQARRDGVVRPLLVFGGALVAGAALAALTILPFLELLGRSGEVSRRTGVAAAFVDRKYLLALLLPDWWGRPTQSALQGYEVTRAFYSGVLTLALAAAALLLRPRLERVAVAAFGLLTLAVVLGIPPVFDVVTALPGFSATYNTRLTILFLLCVALLAGWGLDELTERVPRERRMTVLLAALGLALVVVPAVALAAESRISLRFLGDALGVASGFAHPPGLSSPDVEAVVRLAALVVWLLAAGAALVLLALRRAGRLTAGTFAALAVAIVVVDLFRAGMGQNPGLTLVQARQPVTGAIRYLQARRPARFVGLLARNGALALPPDVAMRYGLYDARSYDYPVERRYDRLWRREVAPPRSYQPSIILAQSTPRALRTLSLLGVTDLLSQKGEPPPPGLRVAYNGPDATVYANDGALPRAWLAGAQQVVRGERAALSAITAPGFAARRTVVTEHRLSGLPEGDRPPAGEARLVGYGAEHVTIEARANRPAELVLSDVSYPGWQATVEGRRVPLHRVDYLLRGVSLPPGAHRVEMTYEPHSWRVGWIVSALALGALAAAAVLGVRRRRAT